MPKTLCQHLQFPTGVVAHGDTMYVTESGLDPTGRPTTGCVLKVIDGDAKVLTDGLRAPVTGLTMHDGYLYVSEGGRPGRISRIDTQTGDRETLLDNLPGGGDYHTNTPIVHDGWLYFGQGAATNSGIVSWDPVSMPWLKGTDLPHDLPGFDVELTDPDGSGLSEAFQPFGAKSAAGTRIPGQLPCTSGVMRCKLDGAGLELVAWGMRNPFGLHTLPNGRILVIDLGMNDRGVRPVGQTQSVIWQLDPGNWYGYPDFAASELVSDKKFCSQRPGAKLASPLLANHDELGPVPRPLVRFAPNSGPTQMLFDPGSDTLLVALFGDKRPITGVLGTKVGRSLVRVSLETGDITPCDLPGLQRPIALCWHGDQVLLLDFGEYELGSGGKLKTAPPTGTLYSLSRNELDIATSPLLEVTH